MLENYFVHIEYKEGGEIKTATSSNEDLEIKYVKNNACLSLIVKVNIPIEITKIWLDTEYDFGANDKFFANGYQSWTDSREYGRNEKMKDCGLVAKTFIGKKLGLRSYGDYDFVKYSGKRGVFHSHGYAYVNRGEEIDFVGSLSDSKGYTIIKADMRQNKIYIYKDIEGVIIDNTYEVFKLIALKGEYNEVFDKYFAMLGIPKPISPIIKGYTTWYNYYQNINEQIVLRDLENISHIKNVNTFQIDDGYQSKVGEWLNIDFSKFPNGLECVVQAIHDKGFKAGLWLAPFAVQKDSDFVQTHADWLVRNKEGKLIVGGANWGGFYVLDIYNGEVRQYLKEVFLHYRNMGVDLFKLDFLYASCIVPNYNKSRGEIMYDAIALLRECVGDRQILACGVPLMPCFGRVEYMRIGADMGLGWKKTFIQRLTHREDVNSQDAIYNSLYRRHLNKRAFLCDPDVLLLRDYNLSFGWQQRKLISNIIKIFGGVLFTSDDVGRYNADQLAQLEYVMQNNDMWVENVIQNGNIVTINYSIDGKAKQLVFDITTCKEIK